MAHKGSQRSCPQFGITKDFEWKSKNHEKIRNHCVLKKNNKVGFTADLKENPHCQAVCDESNKKQDSIEEREEDLADFVVSGTQAAIPSHRGEVVHGLPCLLCYLVTQMILKDLNVSRKW